MQMVRVCLVVADGRESLMGRPGEVIDLAGASWVLESMIVKRDGPLPGNNDGQPPYGAPA